MNKEETNALQWLTGKTNLDEVSVEELEQLTTEHPYFSAAHLLLAKKMKQVNHPDLQKNLYRTALYFPDEQWLRYLLSEKKAFRSPDENINNFHSHKETIDETLLSTEMVAQPKTEKFISVPANGVLKHIPDIKTIRDEPEEAPLEEDEMAAQSEPLPIDESNQKIALVLSEQAVKFEAGVDDDKLFPIAAEPFHTVDYFASQGIKLEPKKEETSFDTKVHKFTDWLRQMKRINSHPADLGTDAEQENFVVNIAATSNHTKEIITESMAEVLLKQNKYEKAIEIYQKLSLLHPFKNAYFAAKIEQLKQ